MLVYLEGVVMFVSSYNTYIDTNASAQVQKERAQNSKESSAVFKTHIHSQMQTDKETLSSQKSQLPLSYVSNYKVMNNQQKLQDAKLNNEQSEKFTKISNQKSANSAYVENSTLFSLVLKPKATLNQTPSVNTTLPPKAQEAQESLLKNKMVNTYIANDNYYKITA